MLGGKGCGPQTIEHPGATGKLEELRMGALGPEMSQGVMWGGESGLAQGECQECEETFCGRLR